MKTPDEIKQALECCFYDSAQCADCPYYPVNCDRELVRDAREYIRQLETERDAAVEDMESMAAYVMDDVCEWCAQTAEGCKHPCNFKWRGVQKEE